MLQIVIVLLILASMDCVPLALIVLDLIVEMQFAYLTLIVFQALV